MTPINGEDVELYVYRSGVPVPVACGTDVSLEFTVELIETATIDSGTDEDFDAGFVGCTVNASGLSTFDATSKWQFKEFIDNLRGKQRIVIEFTDTLGEQVNYDMYVLVERVSIGNPVDDFSTWDVTMRRCGPHTTGTVIPVGGGGIGSMIVGSTFIIG